MAPISSGTTTHKLRIKVIGYNECPKDRSYPVTVFRVATDWWQPDIIALLEDLTVPDGEMTLKINSDQFRYSKSMLACYPEVL